ncbi:MAG: hypothetical protein HRU15_01085 [Planctomycetes bacterium]|nr:hypothetical protein [Planctomycetota bacterium]
MIDINPNSNLYCGKYCIYNVDDGDQRNYLSALPHHYGLDYGVPDLAILGEFKSGVDNFDPNNFVQHNAFLDFFSWVIEKHVLSVERFVDEIMQTKDGFVTILDRRLNNLNDGVSPEDILSAVEISNCTIVNVSCNPNYRVLTDRGVMDIESKLFNYYVEELKLLSKGESSYLES